MNEKSEKYLVHLIMLWLCYVGFVDQAHWAKEVVQLVSAFCFIIASLVLILIEVVDSKHFTKVAKKNQTDYGLVTLKLLIILLLVINDGIFPAIALFFTYVIANISKETARLKSNENH